MPQNKPMPGEIYRHFKNKNYQIIAVATHSETREPYVVYQALYDDFRTYIRPYDMFISEVDHVKYPEVMQKYRFELVGSHVMTESEAEPSSQREPADVVDSRSTTIEQDPELAGVHPGFLAFLDTDSFDEKLEILSSMEADMNDHLINQMAASIDVIVEDGPIDNRIMELRKCIRTRARYELGRNR